MDKAEKARENRLRRMLERRGFRLSKSRRRDPGAWDYGLYSIDTPDGLDSYSASRDLDDIEDWIRNLDAGNPAGLPGLNPEDRPWSG